MDPTCAFIEQKSTELKSIQPQGTSDSTYVMKVTVFKRCFFLDFTQLISLSFNKKIEKENLAVHRSHQSQSTQRMLLASLSEVKGVYKYVFLLFVFFFSQKTKNKKTFHIKYKKTKKCWQSNKIKPVTQEVKCKFIEKCLKKVVTYVIFDKDIKKVFYILGPFQHKKSQIQRQIQKKKVSTNWWTLDMKSLI